MTMHDDTKSVIRALAGWRGASWGTTNVPLRTYVSGDFVIA